MQAVSKSTSNRYTSLSTGRPARWTDDVIRVDIGHQRFCVFVVLVVLIETFETFLTFLTTRLHRRWRSFVVRLARQCSTAPTTDRTFIFTTLHRIASGRRVAGRYLASCCGHRLRSKVSPHNYPCQRSPDDVAKEEKRGEPLIGTPSH